MSKVQIVQSAYTISISNGEKELLRIDNKGDVSSSIEDESIEDVAHGEFGNEITEIRGIIVNQLLNLPNF